MVAMVDALHSGYMRLLKGLLVIADVPQSIASSALRNTFYSKNEYIYIYRYTPVFKKFFHIERYIDRYILGSTIIFLFVRFFVPIFQLKK